MTSELDYPEPVSKLINLGRPVDPWPDYPTEFGFTTEHIPELIRMVTDARSWEEDETDPAVYRNVHAWRALGQMRAAEAIPGLLDALR